MPSIVRYTPPTRYDVAEYGTIRRVMESDKPLDLYVQISKDIESPIWNKMGDFLEKVFRVESQDEEFVKKGLLKIEQEERL